MQTRKFSFIALLIYPIVGGGDLDAPLYTKFCEFCVFLRAKPEESLRHRRNMRPKAARSFALLRMTW